MAFPADDSKLNHKETEASILMKSGVSPEHFVNILIWQSWRLSRLFSMKPA